MDSVLENERRMLVDCRNCPAVSSDKFVPSDFTQREIRRVRVSYKRTWSGTHWSGGQIDKRRTWADVQFIECSGEFIFGQITHWLNQSAMFLLNIIPRTKMFGFARGESRTECVSTVGWPSAAGLGAILLNTMNPPLETRSQWL